MSSQIWCYLKFPLPGGGGGGGNPKIKVAQNGLKHGLVLEFLRSDEIIEILCVRLTRIHPSIHPYRHDRDQISRSARRAGATNKNQVK